ncbi:shikimate dehydrogenase family protein [Novosphingobium piscinae]|uniref:Shikimate dehydrogenase (NADP(+)) n=1 Tax=Novosphingobium piscinae TaxID=1507448 RepID=A0A7X1FZU9_9SPHN|nr:shikimate dehydrogenase [Novosphingobium piscinae]MBC2670053.1 shikimate dehydrogenase [Novosphingobium piscinae]
MSRSAPGAGPQPYAPLGAGPRPYAEVIGDPIAQSKSPLIHGFWLTELGIAANYRGCHVTPDGLAGYLAARRCDPAWRGCNVTMPHKQAIMPLLDRVDPLARRVGAVNTVVRAADGTLTGFNTDVPGFLEPLAPLLARPHLFRMARILGTGGAARAIVSGLAERGFVLVLAGRDPGKARALLDELAPQGDHHAVDLAHFAAPTDFAFDDRAGCCDLVVNASLLGMTGQPPLRFDWSHAPPGSLAYDIVTAPLDTPFLQGARAAGFATVDGLAMLIGQADSAFTHFFGQAAPRGRDAELRRMIARG